LVSNGILENTRRISPSGHLAIGRPRHFTRPNAQRKRSASLGRKY
jgi:hypothetical protein